MAWSLRGGGGVRAVPLRKRTSFLKLYLSYFKTKKVPFATKLKGGGGKSFFAASLINILIVYL